MSESMAAIVRRLIGGAPFAIGDIVSAPTGKGHVKIISGQWCDPIYGRLSNFWYWQPLDADGNPVGAVRQARGDQPMTARQLSNIAGCLAILALAVMFAAIGGR